MTKLVACGGCGAILPDIEGPRHRYLGASPGCWQVYGEVLAGAGGITPHRLLVDVYAARHPGVPGKQSSQSVAAHLFVVCLVMERGLDPSFATRAITWFVEKHKGQAFLWAEPPTSLGPVTVLDVASTRSQEEHNEAVMRWVASVWNAWEPYHERVRAWADEWNKGNKGPDHARG